MSPQGFSLGLLALLLLPALGPGCSRTFRSKSLEEKPTTAGSADEPKNMGDTRAKTIEDGKSPSASPTGLSKDAKPGEAPPPATGGATRNPG